MKTLQLLVFSSFCLFLTLAALMGAKIDVTWQLLALMFALSLFSSRIFSTDHTLGVLSLLGQLGRIKGYLRLKVLEVGRLTVLLWFVLLLINISYGQTMMAWVLLAALPGLVQVTLFIASFSAGQTGLMAAQLLAMVFMLPFALFTAGSITAIAIQVVPVAPICYNLALSILYTLVLPRFTQYALVQAMD